jgi:hypothetical protein
MRVFKFAGGAGRAFGKRIVHANHIILHSARMVALKYFGNPFELWSGLPNG